MSYTELNSNENTIEVNNFIHPLSQLKKKHDNNTNIPD